MSNYDPRTRRFYCMHHQFYFEESVIKNELISKYQSEGLEYYQKLIRVSRTMSKWNKIQVVMVRFHIVVLRCSKIYDSLTQLDKGSLGEYYTYILNTIQPIFYGLPLSQMLFKYLGLTEILNDIVDLIAIADKTDLFCLSAEMINYFNQLDIS